MQSSDWLLSSSHLARDILNFSSKYFWILDRKIDIGNNKVNYLKKFLVTHKKDNKKAHSRLVGGGKVFHFMSQ